MKQYAELTSRGQARRLRKLVIVALGQYALDVADVRLVGMHTNALFRVRTMQGKSYLVRVCKPGWRTETDLFSEIAWLRALDRDTDIGAPLPLAARSGEFVVCAGAEGVPEARRCVVTSWVPGVLLGRRLNEANLYKMGALFARLHTHGATFSPPEGFTRRKMDRIFARGEEDVLFDAACLASLPPRPREILEQTRQRVDAAFARLYADPAGLRVIHNDLWHDNIKIDRGRLRPLDFEDTVWGYPVQDLAMGLQDLMSDVAPEAFEPLQDALRRGYESQSEWPEAYAGEIDTFRAGRMVWVTNYVARFQARYLQAHAEWVAPQLEQYLETGILRKGR
ncbi:MAG: phosphotransferase [Anaerolineae bacterium]|nr:phosphotransferase [Anaerolineae bacterium]